MKQAVKSNNRSRRYTTQYNEKKGGIQPTQRSNDNIQYLRKKEKDFFRERKGKKTFHRLNSAVEREYGKQLVNARTQQHVEREEKRKEMQAKGRCIKRDKAVTKKERKKEKNNNCCEYYRRGLTSSWPFFFLVNVRSGRMKRRREDG